MTAPGWYPDPTGQRGPRGQRYWDGQRWHDTIPPPPPRGGTPRWLIAVGATTALLLVGAVTAVVAKQSTERPAAPSTAAPTSRTAPRAVEPAPSTRLIQQDRRDELFLQVLRGNGVQFGSDDDAILKAQGVCVGLAQGAPIPEILQAIQDVAPPMTPADAGFLLGAAAEAYCPELSPVNP